MDWIRLIVLCMNIVVFALYVNGTWRLLRALRANRAAPHQTRTVVWGRVMRYLAVVCFTVAAIEGNIELWGAHHTPRIFMHLVGLCFAMAGYLVVDKAFRDEDVFKFVTKRGD
jgi:hypothetical protein